MDSPESLFHQDLRLPEELRLPWLLSCSQEVESYHLLYEGDGGAREDPGRGAQDAGVQGLQGAECTGELSTQALTRKGNCQPPVFSLGNRHAPGVL